MIILTALAAIGACGCAQFSTNGAPADQPANQSKIVLIPSEIDFSTVVIGQKNSQTLKLSNTDTKSVKIHGISVVGAGLRVTAVTLPFTLDPQASETFNIEFAPTSVGAVSGKLTVDSSIASQTFVVKGLGAKAAAKLQTDPISIDFGKVAVKKATQRKVTISNTGNSKISVSKVVVTGTGFSVSGLPSQFALEAQQQSTFEVTFHPQAKGVVKGLISVVSKDLTAPLSVNLAGNAVDPGSIPAGSGHSVTLEWAPSAGNVSGYNVYRSGITGGPYDRLASLAANDTKYVDTDVLAGDSYYYVVTAVNHGGHESRHSEEISVTIPTP